MGGISPVTPAGALSETTEAERTRRIGEVFQRLIRAAENADMLGMSDADRAVANGVRTWLQRRMDAAEPENNDQLVSLFERFIASFD
jgi:hypothetical protein